MAEKKDKVSEDARAVNKAANLLGLREFDFFRLAHRRWFSRDVEPDQLEKIFAAYMFSDTVPPWVRHCSRDVLFRDDMNKLDPAEFGVGDFGNESKVPRVGRAFLIVAGVLMLIAYISLLTTRHGFDDANCPGRYANRFVEQWVYMIQGEQPPPCNPATGQDGVKPPARQ